MSTVAQAETALAVARVEEQKQKREDARREIQRLTAEGAKLKAELEPLVTQVKQAQNERLHLHGQLLQARSQIASYSAPLDPLTFPSAKDEAERRKQLAAWQEQQKELLKQHRTVVERESVRPYAVKVQQTLVRLQYEIANLTAIAEGRRPGQLAEGGLFTVGEDFLGNSQCGPPRHLGDSGVRRITQRRGLHSPGLGSFPTTGVESVGPRLRLFDMWSNAASS